MGGGGINFLTRHLTTSLPPTHPFLTYPCERPMLQQGGAFSLVCDLEMAASTPSGFGNYG